MAWNQPNGGNNNGGSNGQRPPEIDDFLKKINQNFDKWFGNAGQQGNPDNAPFKIALVVVGALTVLSGFYRVEQAEEAVVLRFGKYSSTESAGLHWSIPLVDEVKNKHSSFVITKRKVPIAKVVPLDDKGEKKKSYFGFLRGSIKINDDIVNTSFEDDWEVNG